MKSWLKRHYVDLYFLTALGAVLYFFLRHIRAHHDLDHWDEAYYAEGGEPATYRGMGWAPLYVLLYRLVRATVAPDMMDAFYFVAVLIPVLLTVLQYFLSRRLQISPVLSFVGSIFALLSLNHANTNKLNHFNVLCYYAIFLCLTFVKRPPIRSLAMALASVVLIYVRQDNVVIGAVFLGYSLWQFATLTAPAMRRVQSASLAAGSFFALLFFFTTLATPFDPTRTWSTFRDHFNWRYSDRHPEPSSRAAGFFGDHARKHFGKAASIRQAFQNSPTEFSRHVWANVSQMPSRYFEDLNGRVPLFRSDRHENYLLVALLLLLGAGLFATEKLPIGRTVTQQIAIRFAKRTEHETLWWVFGLACLIKACSTIWLLSPWTRYHLEFLFFSYVAICWFLDRWAGSPTGRVYQLLAAVLVVSASTWPARTAPVPLQKLVTFTRRIPDPAGRRFFGHFTDSLYTTPMMRHTGMEVYDRLRERGEVRTFSDYLKKDRFDLVIMDDFTARGLQFVEQRYGVTLTREDLHRALTENGYTIATTYENHFVLYTRSGLAMKAADELARN